MSAANRRAIAFHRCPAKRWPIQGQSCWQRRASRLGTSASLPVRSPPLSLIRLAGSSELVDRAENMQDTTISHGLSLQEKEAFVRGALPAMAQHTFGFICSVIGISAPEMGRHYGSALRCQLNGRRAILTALHVIE